ncbi:F-box only protein 4 [Protopterus annectens]|uniref:F-box only protein 4 n=1 Tax=Protopterus annectens TaxID=7888 RepID=UPI001CF94A14|nr:F-box only protein 4 [Protopterus annectens]
MAESNFSQEGEWGRWGSAVGSLRTFWDRYLPSLRKLRDKQKFRDVSAVGGSETEEGEEQSLLQRLPMDIQLYIMAFLRPYDVCQLGCTNRYWNSTVRDPILWRYFLLRDLSSWCCVGSSSLPGEEMLTRPLCEFTDSASFDYMSAYLKCGPACRRRHLKPRQAVHRTVAFLYSLMTSEPRFALFGPGLEQLDLSLVKKMMTTPEVLAPASVPPRQINGIGSGISFLYNNQHSFNILTLYSTTSKERAKARIEQSSTVNKIFMHEDEEGTDGPRPFQYTVIPQVQEVCRVVDGFIYVANAEPNRRHEQEDELAQMQALLELPLGSATRPLLVLSTISTENGGRIPCVYIAHLLKLSHLKRPWLVQDVTVESLNGLLDGIQWILEEAGVKT